MTLGETAVDIVKKNNINGDPDHFIRCKQGLIGHASLIVILREVTRFAGFLHPLEQNVLSLVFHPMLSLLGIL